PVAQGWRSTRDHSRIGNYRHVAFQCIAIFLQKTAEVNAANFFLAFDHQMQIHRQVGILFDRLLDTDDVRKNLTLVVRRAAGEDVSVLENGLEWRRIPKLQWIRRLHIVMPVDQNCPASGLMFVARPDDRVPLRGNELRLQPDARKFFHETICTLLQLFFVLVISRNTWKSQKGIELLKIIVAHGQKLIGFRRLPTTSDGAGRGLDTRSTRAQARFRSPQIPEPSRARESK